MDLPGEGRWSSIEQGGDYSLSMKTLQKKGTQEETSRPKLSRGSTILDYINVVPKTRFLVSGQLYFQTNIPCSLCSSSFPNPPTPMLQRYKGETSIQDETQTPAPSQSSRLLLFSSLRKPFQDLACISSFIVTTKDMATYV